MSKDDPLQQSRYPQTTLLLTSETMVQARENFWRAYNELNPTAIGNLDDHHTWDVAWAASIAAFSFMMEGRIEP